MKRRRSQWGHGHSLGAGALVGIGFASYRVWLLLAVAFLAGCLVTLLVSRTHRLVTWAKEMTEQWRLERQAKQKTRLSRLRERQARDRFGF